jgi:hypothetical protein
MASLPLISGGVDAYEFYAEFALQFLCDVCGEHLDTRDKDTDDDAPFPPWATREGKRGMALGWYVPPLTPDGSLVVRCLCPACATTQGLRVQTVPPNAP